MSFQVIPNAISRETIETLAEQFRFKGRGVFRKKPIESLSYIKMVLWPVQYFEICKAKKGRLETNTDIHAVRNFMLGYFSLPFVETVLKTDGGRKALGTIFSRENQSILSIRTRKQKPYPVLPSYKAEDVYHQINKQYLYLKSQLESDLIDITKEMEPVYAESMNFQNKADEVKKKMVNYYGSKKSDRYKALRKTHNDHKKKSTQLRRKADAAIAHGEKTLRVFNRKWKRGQIRYLGLRPKFEIVKFGELDTFYNMFWVVRYESSSSSRYLVFDKTSQQVRPIQNMLNFDEKLRNELDSILKFKSSIKSASCFYCGAPTNKSQNICSNCSKDIQKCSVCKLPISQTELTATCPKCESVAHLSHLHEWIKTQGKCPTCLQEVKLRNLILSEEP